MLTLYFVGTRLGNNASQYLLEAAESNSTIVDLDLSTNYMEDEGEALEQFLTTMTTTTVTDTTLATTTSTKTTNRSHVQQLNLSYNWITERSAHGMGRGLRHNQQLVELKLHGCLFVRREQLGVAETRNSAMAATQPSLSALRTLKLFGFLLIVIATGQSVAVPWNTGMFGSFLQASTACLYFRRRRYRPTTTDGRQ